MNDSVSIAFFLRGTRLNVKGMSPVYARVSINGRRVNSSTGIFVDPTKWVPGRAAVKGNNEYARTINTSLDNMRNAILKFINTLEANPISVNFEKR